MKFWAITLADISGFKGYFNSTEEILKWLDKKYNEVRELSAHVVTLQCVKTKVYHLPVLEVAKKKKYTNKKGEKLDYYCWFVHVVNVEKSSLPVEMFMKTS